MRNDIDNRENITIRLQTKTQFPSHNKIKHLFRKGYVRISVLFLKNGRLKSIHGRAKYPLHLNVSSSLSEKEHTETSQSHRGWHTHTGRSIGVPRFPPSIYYVNSPDQLFLNIHCWLMWDCSWYNPSLLSNSCKFTAKTEKYAFNAFLQDCKNPWLRARRPLRNLLALFGFFQ